ncbi:hypothetical protein PPACK8108_LOCUS6787 [Phakopsora pachyrhizi]|uniref:Uncharacterized protein n=1 Tax=Phakopsora pachyrhizi TaxID=170000 RepID=A0AAV0ATN3_PHAPC|nr:hypothetical protein PPACK8108_LOCUS6787 [Phakopsora pachyrhizi]
MIHIEVDRHQRMRAKAIEICWHNTKPIYSTNFQPTTPSNLDDLLQNKSHP